MFEGNFSRPRYMHAANDANALPNLLGLASSKSITERVETKQREIMGSLDYMKQGDLDAHENVNLKDESFNSQIQMIISAITEQEKIITNSLTSGGWRDSISPIISTLPTLTSSNDIDQIAETIQSRIDLVQCYDLEIDIHSADLLQERGDKLRGAQEAIINLLKSALQLANNFKNS